MGGVRIYLEGGGDGKYLDVLVRKVFQKFFEKAGFVGRLPSVRPYGGRGSTYDAFCIALKSSTNRNHPILLVDSEDPVNSDPWTHLRTRDGWDKPEGAQDDHVHLMVTCMETWIMADRDALRKVFHDCLTEGSLLSDTNLESRDRDDVQTSLESATRGCGKRREYRKGRRSFQIIEELDPGRLKDRLPYLNRLLETLNAKL